MTGNRDGKDDTSHRQAPRRGEDPRFEARKRRSEGKASQGIVRDQRGQEQPADKERAQQASKSR